VLLGLKGQGSNTYRALQFTPGCRSGFKTPPDTRWSAAGGLQASRNAHPPQADCAFESARALPSGVIRGFETTSIKWLPENAETIHSRSPACQTEKLAPGGNLSLTRGRAALPYAMQERVSSED
jgi:hypothetical protein